MSAALPALEAARLALADLDKNDITEIRSFATPPEAVQVFVFYESKMITDGHFRKAFDSNINKTNVFELNLTIAN